MPVVGPGAAQEIATDVKPMLEGASEYEYVTILNPLSDDFAIRVAQDVPVNMPLEIRGKTGVTQTERDVIQGYGLSLKNPDFTGRKHIINDTIIKAGGTINLKGNEAQVAVKQIVDEMMQRAGDTRLMIDPSLRMKYEAQVVMKRGSVQELMDSNMNTVNQQINAAINRSNEVENEPTSQGTEGVGSEGRSQEAGTSPVADSDESSARRVGRPKKTDS